MKGYTKIPNNILNPSQLSVEARYLYAVLLRYCGNDDSCFPSQKTLGQILNVSDRHIRNILHELLVAKLVIKKRRGWNRSNTYTVTKSLSIERNGISYHVGSAYPLQQGSEFPDNNTYLKGKGKKSFKGLEHLREVVIEKTKMR